MDENYPALSSMPKCLDTISLSRLLSLLESLPVCPGHPDTHFLEMVDAKKGQLYGKSGNIVAFTDSFTPVHFNGQFYARTVRTASCELLAYGGKCSSCKDYHPHLRALFSDWTTQKQKEVSKFTNNQHLSTPQKQKKMKSLTARAKEGEKQVKRVQHIIEQSVEANGTAVDPNFHNDLVAIMEDKSQEINDKYPTGTFKNLFWEQQLKAAKVKGPNGFRWHPIMIRWCLNLKMMSSVAYHAMRSAGFVTLPSERTLQDYSNFFQPKPGFQPEVNKQLMREAKLKELDDPPKACGISIR